jgi:hypothetical protein
VEDCRQQWNELRQIAEMVRYGAAGERELALIQEFVEFIESGAADIPEAVAAWNATAARAIVDHEMWNEITKEMTDIEERKFIEETGLHPREYIQWREAITLALASDRDAHFEVLGIPESLGKKTVAGIWEFVVGRIEPSRMKQS